MKHIFTIFPFVIFFISCGSNKSRNEPDNRPIVTVSIVPQKTFVQKISGDDFDVHVLIPPGASPATYTLLPSQISNLGKSKAWFRIGHIGFEYSWKEKIEQANPMMEVADLSEGLDLIKSDHSHERGHVSGVDPHIWMSPSLVKQFSKKIADVLIKLNPDREEIYKANYSDFLKEIEQTDYYIKNALSDYQGRHFIMFHPSLTYLAREYGLIQHSLESEGKEPSPQHMAEIMGLAKRENIRVIYIQSEFDRENARVFAEETGGKIIEVSPLSPDWAENLMNITNVLIENFK
ncbi:MAG: zinc ABC transporter substrate-binding protein [Prolixibacteraceae bacterium]|jgi:zinc transport system substrate-binding protein|nr:zinc ABC transporter substrate-binding protein [Prolixibacteraceae bacterium]MDD4754606.1 zinc ABC transporter substrate-binding protein [Prolixibacteraceae bacterium]NLO01962.1 zinc ABC transporter solute-binding protein [Bacteroidales bacterium]